MKMSASNPKYKIGDVVYLRESAMLGFIESYQVGGIRIDPRYNKWTYEIYIRPRGPETSTVIDMATLRNINEKLAFMEDELIEFCDALAYAITNTTNRLNYLISQKISKCGGSEGNP
jgi:hypothetical protein